MEVLAVNGILHARSAFNSASVRISSLPGCLDRMVVGQIVSTHDPTPPGYETHRGGRVYVDLLVTPITFQCNLVSQDLSTVPAGSMLFLLNLIPRDPFVDHEGRRPATASFGPIGCLIDAPCSHNDGIMTPYCERSTSDMAPAVEDPYPVC